MNPNTQAVLLLTAPLQIGRASTDADLLSLGEYNELARFLHQRGWQPGDLLEGRAAECPDPARLQRLLERSFLLGQAVDRWDSLAIRVLTRGEEGYPRRLKTRLKDAAPPVLYLAGKADLLESGGLAILGEDLELGPSIGAEAAAAATTVLGTSLGSAHLAALEAGGKAVGMLPFGLDKAALVRDYRTPLREGRLALVSPTDPSGKPNHPNSQLVYALADRAFLLSLKPPEVRSGAQRQRELGWIPLDGAPATRALLKA